MNVQRIVTKLGRKFKHASPTLLTWVGAGGVVATSILAVRATPKAMKIIAENTGYNHDGEMYSPSKMEIVQLTFKCYIPSALVGASTIVCIFGANVLNKKQQASIASIYAMMDQSYQQYRKAANEVYGEDADSQIRAQVAKDVYFSSDGYAVYDPDIDPSDKVLFYDEFSKQYFTSTMAGVINAQYHLNRNWSLQGEVSVNEYYGFLGIDKLKGGDDIGWTYEFAEEGLMRIDFDISKIEMDDGLECFLISYIHEPIPLDWTAEDVYNSYLQNK